MKQAFYYLYLMRKLSIVFIAVLLLAGCNDVNTKLKERITASDSAVINFYKGDGGMDTVTSVKIIRDKKILEQLTNLIPAKKTSLLNNCGYDGSLHFFKNNLVVQDIDFRMNNDKEGCSQFSFSLDGEKGATKLSAEAARLLNTQWKLPAPGLDSLRK